MTGALLATRAVCRCVPIDLHRSSRASACTPLNLRLRPPAANALFAHLILRLLGRVIAGPVVQSIYLRLGGHFGAGFETCDGVVSGHRLTRQAGRLLEHGQAKGNASDREE